MHEHSLSREGGQVILNGGEHIPEVHIQINEPLVNRKTVLVVPAANVEGANSRGQLYVQRGALCLEGVSPSTSGHGRVRAQDGELTQRDPIVHSRHPGFVAVRGRVVVVQGLSLNHSQKSKVNQNKHQHTNNSLIILFKRCMNIKL